MDGLWRLDAGIYRWMKRATCGFSTGDARLLDIRFTQPLRRANQDPMKSADHWSGRWRESSLCSAQPGSAIGGHGWYSVPDVPRILGSKEGREEPPEHGQRSSVSKRGQ